jgi:hypothetical protein
LAGDFMTKEMPMTREEILSFLNHNPVCHVATMEEGRPRVRGMFMYRADDRGLLFHTGTFKALAKQVQAGAPSAGRGCAASARRSWRAATGMWRAKDSMPGFCERTA